MNHILKDLYLGKIDLAERKISDNSQYLALQQKICKMEEVLKEEIGQEGMELHEAILNIQAKISDLWEQETFSLGFRLGAQMILAVVTDPIKST